jgi:hypothetical protein
VLDRLVLTVCPGQRGEFATMNTISVAMLGVVPSLTSNVKVSYPIAPGFGVYVNAPVTESIVTLPWVGWAAIEKPTLPLSMSVACSMPLTGVASCVVTTPVR